MIITVNVQQFCVSFVVCFLAFKPIDYLNVECVIPLSVFRNQIQLQMFLNLLQLYNRRTVCAVVQVHFRNPYSTLYMCQYPLVYILSFDFIESYSYKVSCKGKRKGKSLAHLTVSLYITLISQLTGYESTSTQFMHAFQGYTQPCCCLYPHLHWGGSRIQ